MASVRERNGKYQARVTYDGKTVTRTFTNKSDATKWSRSCQVDLERGLIEPARPTITLHDVLARYIKEVLPSKRGKQQELCILKAWQRRPIAGLKLTEVKPSDVAVARDARLQEVQTGSVRRELGALSSVFTWCIKELQLCETNPCMGIRKPPDGQPRTRRLFPGELERILDAGKRSQDFGAIITIALESAMRRSEVLGMEWRHVDLARGIVHLPMTKSGVPRDVPLSPAARALLESLPHSGDKVFSKDATNLSHRFTMAVARARKKYVAECEAQGVKVDERYLDATLKLHTLRHEATTRLLERGFSISEAGMAVGHASAGMTARYTHLAVESLVTRLAA